MTLSVFRMNTCKKKGEGGRSHALTKVGQTTVCLPVSLSKGATFTHPLLTNPTLSIQSTHKPQTQPRSAPHETPPSAEYSQTLEAGTPQSPKPPPESSRQQPRHWQQTAAIVRRRSSPQGPRE